MTPSDAQGPQSLLPQSDASSSPAYDSERGSSALEWCWRWLGLGPARQPPSKEARLAEAVKQLEELRKAILESMRLSRLELANGNKARADELSKLTAQHCAAVERIVVRNNFEVVFRLDRIRTPTDAKVD